MANFYIDGTTLQNSTAVYTDAALSNCAPAAFYSDGSISREQVFSGSTCQLLPPQVCPSCATPCGTSISASGGTGVYRLDIDLGGTATDTGAIIIKFDPQSVPDGVIATYNGTTYNKLSSPNFGYLQANNAGTPITTVATYIGSTGSQGQCQAGSIEGTYTNLTVFTYSGSGFVNSGLQETVVINANQNQLTSSAPGNCVMVVPKPNVSPTTISIDAIGPCGGTAWSIDVQCPVKIPRLLAGNGNLDTICSAVLDQYVYHVPVNNSSTQGNVNIHDYIFADADGSASVADGWYLHPTGYIYEVTFGIVVARINDACDVITVDDCKGGGLWSFNDRFGTNTVGEVIKYKRIDSVQQEIPSTTYCGTISSIATGVATNAQQEGFIARDCDDTTHCP